MTAILLALLTAVVWGLANYLGPLLSRTHPLGAILLAGQVVGVVGIPLAVVGVALAARSAPPAGAPQQVRAGIALSLTAALTYGTFLTLFAAAAEDGPATAVLTSRAALLVATFVTLLLLRQRMTVPLRALPRVALPGLLLFVGTASYGIATSTGLVSVVTVLATLNPVITVGLAVLVLGERLAARQQLGVAAALVGVILLAAG